MNTDNRPVTVFAASGRQGLAQVRQLVAAGIPVRAITRTKGVFDDQPGVTVQAADYRDPDSVNKACAGARAVFFTSPSFNTVALRDDIAVSVAKAAKQAAVERVVVNTSMYVPDEPMGQVIYDLRLQMENKMADVGVPLTVFRPVLFMDNLLTGWVKPRLLAEGVYAYPHNPNMEASWICLDDVAKFMIASLDDSSLDGARLVIGGPEVLKPADVAAILSKTLGKPVTFDSLTPRAFAELMWEIFKDVMDTQRDTFIAGLDDFYTFNNTVTSKPMVVDMAPVLARLPVSLTTMADWAAQQDWTPPKPGEHIPMGD